jgi:TRAP-type uncharacterized transport system fused permease subunit
MAETTLSPEALESLARSVAAKLGAEEVATRRVADQMIAFQTEDTKFKIVDAAFKKEISDSLAIIQRQRTMLPIVAVCIAVLSIMMSVVALAGSAQAVSRLSDQLDATQQVIHRLHPEIR